MPMRRFFAFALALSMVLCLAACDTGGNHNASYDAGSVSAGEGDGDNPDSASSPPASDYAALYEKYVDVSALPVLEIDMDDVCVFDDRTLTLADSIHNEPELLTYNLFYYTASAQFDLMMDLVGPDASVWTAMNNERVNFEQGYYLTEHTIHMLSTLTAEDLDHVAPFGRESILNRISTFCFEEYVIVKTEKSWKYNEAYAAAGPQLDDGETYIRYYLFAKTAQVPDFKLYEVYWEDFFLE